MGMRISFGLVCAGATTLLSACGSVDEPSLGEQVAEVEQKNVVQRAA